MIVDFGCKSPISSATIPDTLYCVPSLLINENVLMSLMLSNIVKLMIFLYSVKIMIYSSFFSISLNSKSIPSNAPLYVLLVVSILLRSCSKEIV